MMRFLVLTISFFLFSLWGHGFYISLDQGGRNYNSDSVQRYSVASFSPLYAKLMEVPGYRGKVELLRQLPCSFAGTIIDPFHAVSAWHVAQPSHRYEGTYYTFYRSNHGRKGALFGSFLRREPYPGADLGLVTFEWIARWTCFDPAFSSEPSPAIDQVAKRYRSFDVAGKKLYYLSTTINNSSGGVVLGPSDDQGDNHDICFATCKLMSGQNPATQSEVYLQIVDHDGLKMRTYGGDSGGPVFIRVAHTGDPYKDFELFGVCSIPMGDKLKVVPMNNPNVGAWIDSEIIQDALQKPSEEEI